MEHKSDGKTRGASRECGCGSLQCGTWQRSLRNGEVGEPGVRLIDRRRKSVASYKRIGMAREELEREMPC